MTILYRANLLRESYTLVSRECMFRVRSRVAGRHAKRIFENRRGLCFQGALACLMEEIFRKRLALRKCGFFCCFSVSSDLGLYDEFVESRGASRNSK